MGFTSGLAVFGGAGLGALLRWGLGILLNHRFPTIPLGTLASNLIGGYLIGVAVGYFALNETLAPELRLFVITGFLGGLTTFSTFSSEVVQLMARGQAGWAVVAINLHLLGSLMMTLFGMLTTRWLLIR